jgi:hypothetical protein
MTKLIKKGFFKLTKLDIKRLKVKRKRLRAKKRARRARRRMTRLQSDKHISEDECEFDFNNSGRALCSTSEDDSDGPQGTNK